MRGLPPPPPDVLRLVQEFDINGKTSSVGFWLQGPSIGSALPASLELVAAQWFITCLPNLLALMHRGSSATTCRLSIAGLTVLRAAPPNVGLYTGGQADNVALGLKWQTSERGRRGWALTYVPAVPDVFIANNWQLDQRAWGNLIDSGSHLFAAMSALPDPSGAPLAPGTVHVSHGGAPLATAVFSRFVGVSPTPKVVTIRRRIPSSGGLSSLP